MSEDRAADDISTRWTTAGFDRLLSVHRPIVLTHLRSVRKRHPTASPDEVIRILEQRYLAAVTVSGATTGTVAVLPGIGTWTALGISGAETVGFLETSALLAQSIAEVHGLPTADPERARTLVMALMLGPAGANLVRQFAGEVTGSGKPRSAYWAELVTKRMPGNMLAGLTTRVRRSFVRRFATRQGASIVFRVMPFGIGAVVGGAGNRIIGRRVIAATRDAFGPAPSRFPDEVGLPDARQPAAEQG